MRRLGFSQLSFLLLGACLFLPVVGCGGDADVSAPAAVGDAVDSAKEAADEVVDGAKEAAKDVVDGAKEAVGADSDDKK